MSASAPAIVNGEPIPMPIQEVVVLSESDFRQIVADRREIQELRSLLKHQEEKYKLLCENYRDIHHRYFEMIKHTLEPFDESNWRPPSPEETVSQEVLLGLIDEMAKERA